MTHFESCVSGSMILQLKRPQVLPEAHVFVESGFIYRTFYRFPIVAPTELKHDNTGGDYNRPAPIFEYKTLFSRFFEYATC